MKHFTPGQSVYQFYGKFYVRFGNALKACLQAGAKTSCIHSIMTPIVFH